MSPRQETSPRCVQLKVEPAVEEAERSSRHRRRQRLSIPRSPSDRLWIQSTPSLLCGHSPGSVNLSCQSRPSTSVRTARTYRESACRNDFLPFQHQQERSSYVGARSARGGYKRDSAVVSSRTFRRRGYAVPRRSVYRRAHNGDAPGREITCSTFSFACFFFFFSFLYFLTATAYWTTLLGDALCPDFKVNS